MTCNVLKRQITITVLIITKGAVGGPGESKIEFVTLDRNQIYKIVSVTFSEKPFSIVFILYCIRDSS